MRMNPDGTDEFRRALAQAAHKNYHQKILAGITVIDFIGETAEFAGMENAVLRDYVWLWSCPEGGNCEWMKWWEAQQYEASDSNLTAEPRLIPLIDMSKQSMRAAQ
jgi:hypothetical protein